MIPPIFATLSADSATTAIIGAGDDCRCYPFDFVPQGSAVPYVSWTTVSGEMVNKLTSGTFIDKLTARVDCWSNDDSQALELAESVRTALEYVGYMVFDNPSDRDEQTRLYRYSMNFEFFV
jgi:hypothetical protein